MKKTTIKVSLILTALVALALIPANTQMIFGYDSPTFAGSSTNPPVCSKEAPAAVLLYEPGHELLPKATDPGQVRLNWLKTDKASKYTIAFGLASGNYTYGLPDVGNTDYFTVSDLTPGATYYFVVRGVNDCMPGAWSREWAATVGGGGVFTGLDTNTGDIVTPPNIPVVPPAGTGVGAPAEGGTGQPSTPPGTYTPPTNQPAPQAGTGFFQSIWNGILGVFGL